jgi:DNA-binding CsgD family transcriptional regulator
VELAGLALDHIPRAFGTNICAVVFAEKPGEPGDVVLQGMAERDYDDYERNWRPQDVLLAKVFVEQVALMRSQVQSEDAFRRSEFFLGYAKRIDGSDCLQAPLYGAGGALAGAVYFARPERCRRFNGVDLRRATVLAGYLSAGLARVSAQHFGGHAGQSVDLSRREREVVSLVAQGLNNLEICEVLQIARETVKQTLRRVYRKLEVNGRAQMVARLAKLGWF